MLAVHGYIGQVAYGVTVGRAREEAADTVGVVSGSPNAVSLLRIRDGELVEVPGGGTVRLDVNDAGTALVALQAWTQVVKVEPAGM